MGISRKLRFVGNGGLKNYEKSVILVTTHVVLYPAPAGIHVTLQDRTSGDLDLVWLEALWNGYRGYRATISGKLWLSGKMKTNIGSMGGWVVPRFCLSRSAIELRVILT